MDTTEDALEVIEQEAAAVGLAVGAPARMARMLAERISLRLGGQLVYIGKEARKAREARNAMICREFTGRNIPELAAKHDLTERQVRKVLKTCPLLQPSEIVNSSL